jgi:acyl-CoA synthetase (AMP-forming)/AMP-acid ligase II
VTEAATIPGLLRRHAGTTGDLLVCDGERLGYAAAERQSAAIARGLLALGAGKGTRVALLFPNGADCVVHWLAATRIGAIALPISTMSTAAELRWLLTHADAEILAAAPGYRTHNFRKTIAAAVPGLDLAGHPPLFDAEVPSLRHVFIADPADNGGRSVSALLRAGEAVDDALLEAAGAAVFPSDRLTIVHTSGSTSSPKGVIHTHGALLRHMARLNAVRGLDARDTLFSNSPFFWIGGLAYSLLATMVAGGRLVCSNAAAAADTLDLLERERPTMGSGFALGIKHLRDDPGFRSRNLSSLTRGNLYPIMPDAVRPADPELRHNLLGMTEAGSVCLLSADEGDQPEHRRGSFGELAPGFEARIVDPDSGLDCGTDETGELWLRGEPLMEGYYGRERHEAFSPDGWYRTGDLVRRSAEGFFYFSGRRGDMIKTGGANVSPREVEAVLREVAAIEECHVIGIDDAQRGQLVVAVVPGSQKPVDEAAVRAALLERLSSYKVPRRILHFGHRELPMLSSGKIDMKSLRQLVRSMIEAQAGR